MSTQREGNPSRSDGASASNTPAMPAINRRSSTPLPGLSTTASSIRNRRSSNLPTQSSLRRVQSQLLEDGDGEDDDGNAIERNVDVDQLEELRKGIIMPGMGGSRGNTESHLDPTKPIIADRGTVPALAAASLQKAVNRDTVKRQSVPPLEGGGNSGSGTVSNASVPKSRLPATLKASLLKNRNTAGSQSKAPTNNAAKTAPGGAKSAKGTPARATRYSLPVRAEKPVRTSKTSGKHVMLPSESQLAPLPDEEEEEEEEEDEEDEDGSSDDESGAEEETEAADAEDATAVEGRQEVKQKNREDAKRRREDAQKNLEDRREETAAQRLAKKPVGAPGYPSSTRFSGLPSTGTGQTFPPLKGPAHARAPPRRPKSSGPAYHTFERLAPSARVHTPLPRLTSYAISPSIHLPTLIGFLRREHGVRPRLYDECAYVVYFKPLLPGFGRAEVRSAPEPPGASPGGESRREREIVEREESGYVGGYFAATNKDDEGDHIDDQGYIMGGEGEGEGGKGRGDRDRGDLTETETEREGRKQEEDGQASGIELSETEMEQHQLVSEAEEEGANALTAEPEDAESGMMTPKALEPRRELSDYLEEAEEQLQAYRDGSLSVQVEEEGLSNADVAGAMDLQHQQHLIESGEADEGMFTRESDVRFGGEEEGHLRSENSTRQQHYSNLRDERRRRRGKQNRRKPTGPNTASHNHDTSTNMLTSRPILEALQVAELIILPYGVLVMYNLSAAEERSIINDVLSSGCVRGGLPYTPDDEETEAFHFCYDHTVPAPRIFNDFFTFRTSNHLLKLSLAHAIAQSTKLSVFEESMQRTLELTSHIPKELASSGELKLKRREALKLTGRLFKLRVDVNLTSNVLDTPELFWSEASLKALYDAIREYLEIDQRVENLNERLAVGNDLLEVIHDHIGSQAMNQITWIIIILIVVACFVACGEISARLVLHTKNRSKDLSLDPDFQVLKQLYYLTASSSPNRQAQQFLLD